MENGKVSGLGDLVCRYWWYASLQSIRKQGSTSQGKAGPEKELSLRCPQNIQVKMFKTVQNIGKNRRKVQGQNQKFVNSHHRGNSRSYGNRCNHSGEKKKKKVDFLQNLGKHPHLKYRQETDSLNYKGKNSMGFVYCYTSCTSSTRPDSQNLFNKQLWNE